MILEKNEPKECQTSPVFKSIKTLVDRLEEMMKTSHCLQDRLFSVLSPQIPQKECEKEKTLSNSQLQSEIDAIVVTVEANISFIQDMINRLQI